ncbi:MAG: hypothetical protein RLZZ543_2034 [Bacteroidota bacterium]|jgi:pimeloyl-ACP methyl ester carboxylesterase
MEFQVGSIQWKATRFGSGPQWLIALHGYGQEASVFRHFAELHHDIYSLLVIDLAYHGTQSSMQKGFIFDEAYASAWMQAMLDQLAISKIGLLGYSIGGRISMSIAAWFPEFIEELILIAPDGMPVSSTYRCLTGTRAGQMLFRKFISSPGIAFLLIRLGEKLKLLPLKVADYFRNEISTEEKRQQLFDTWMAYRKCLPQARLLREQRALPVMCILGKSDKVIPFRKARRFALKQFASVQLLELNMGHNLLSEKAMKQISAYWKQ